MPKKKVKKIFIIDTNVILHDYKCIYKFKENDLVLPIVVLEELDKLKKGSDLISYNAREFTRELDNLAGKRLFSEGIPLGKGLGTLYIETGKEFSKRLLESFSEKTPDHRILAIAEYLKNKYTDRPVILVSKDINLRMKAKSLDIEAEDYESDKVQDIDQFKQTANIITNISDDFIRLIYEAKEGIAIDKFPLKKRIENNNYFILKGNRLSTLVYYSKKEKRIYRVEKRKAYGIEPRNAEQTFALDGLFRDELQLIAITGRAGTGKTLLALAAALHQRKNFNQILVARPIIPLSNRDLGYLPGDVKDKIGPYMQPLYDNLSVIKHKFSPESKEYKNIEEMIKNEELVIQPLAYIRGRSLSGVFFIIDEAQNLTPHEVKTIITRAGENTKLVFTGDIEQIDSPYLDSRSNGLTYMIDKMKNQDLFLHVNLIKGERSYLAELASALL
ncbi:MAG: PhoH family protein [Bacteroidales bacterium]|nr:PhoH family protein [Bacteroidales bacterium]